MFLLSFDLYFRACLVCWTVSIHYAYAYWTMHHLDILIKVGQLDDTWLYYINLLLNMFRMLLHPSSGACDYLVRYCVGCSRAQTIQTPCSKWS